MLISGPNLNNTLVGVHTRFCKELVVITADIELMFHCFLVKEEHRTFLKFFWYSNNYPANKIVEYQMRIHVFSNSPSPAVVIYGLRHVLKESQLNYDPAFEELVNWNFYIDNCLKSLPKVETTASLLQKIQAQI